MFRDSYVDIGESFKLRVVVVDGKPSADPGSGELTVGLDIYSKVDGTVEALECEVGIRATLDGEVIGENTNSAPYTGSLYANEQVAKAYSKALPITVAHTHEEQTVEFLCWASAGEESTEFTIECPVDPIPSKTVQFRVNGGEGDVPEDMTKWLGEELEIPQCDIYREGYLFLGWATSENSGVEFTDTIPADYFGTNYAITLYAVWDDGVYQVLFLGVNVNMPPAIYERGHVYGLPLFTGTYPGYDFDGWESTRGERYADGEAVCDICPEGQSLEILQAVWRRDMPECKSAQAERMGEYAAMVYVEFEQYHTRNFPSDRLPARVEIVGTPLGNADEVQEYSFKYAGNHYDTDESGNPVVTEIALSGEINKAYGSGKTALQPRFAYELKVCVGERPQLSTRYEYSTKYTTLSNAMYTVDFAAGGEGISLFAPMPIDTREGVNVPKKGFFVNGIQYDMTQDEYQTLCTRLGITGGGL